MAQILRGMYVNAEIGRAAAFENQLGLSKPLDYIRIANGKNGWSDWTTSPAWMAGLVKPTGKMIQYCMAPFPQGISSAQGWKDIADGKYDSQLRANFEGVVKAAPGSWDIPFSPGYEGNGNWFEWSITKAIAPDAKRALKKIAQIAKSVSPRFRMIINFAEWNDDRSVRFEDVFPGREFCDDFGMNLYVKQEYQGNDPAGILQALLNSKCGLNTMIAEAKKLGVRGIWIPEWGLRPHASGAAQAEAMDLTPVVSGIGDRLLSEAGNFDRIGWLFWSGRSDSEAYVDPTGTGKFPKLDRAIKALDDRALAVAGGAVPAPSQPAPSTPAPAPAAPAATQPTEAQAAALAALAVVNDEGARARGVYPEPANSAIRQAEHHSFFPMAAFAYAGKAGDTAGEETDPVKAAALVRADIFGADGWPAEAEAMRQKWLGLLAPLLPAVEDPAPEQPAEPEPGQPAPEQPAPGADAIAALQEQIARLQEQLTAEQAARTAVEQRLEAVKAAQAAMAAALA